MPVGYAIKWTDDQDEIIKMVGTNGVTYEGLAARWRVCPRSIATRAYKLGTKMTYWTAEQVNTLKEEWPKDQSVKEIAEKVGKSRNACIGKARRLNLKPKFCNESRERKPEKKRERIYKKRDKIVPPFKKSKPKAPTEVVEFNPIDDAIPIGLMDLRRNTCRAPVSRDKAGMVTYCGCETFPERPFCPTHCRMFYVDWVA